jgi:N-acetyl-anhydromuramyl-L-alanine amidase AmpD
MKKLKNVIAVSIAAGLLYQALPTEIFAKEPEPSLEFIPSPNYSSRSAGSNISAIVLHASERRTLEDVITVFGSKGYQASAHYSIGKNGRVVQHVRESDKAWHAGESRTPDGRSAVNDFSIGIELVNRNDGFDPYPEEQRAALRDLLARLKRRYPDAEVYTHAEVAWPRGRKNDPLGFRMEWLGDDQGSASK